MRKLERMTTPRSKLEVLTRSHRLLVRSLEIFSGRRNGVGAEDIMPILVYIYSHAQLKHLVSSLK